MLELLPALGPMHFESTEVRSPAVDRRGADAAFMGKASDLGTAFGLLGEPDNLYLRESTFSHVTLHYRCTASLR